MKTVYLIQINIADEDQNPEWSPVRVYENKDSAVTRVEQMKSEYGQHVGFRIEMLELH